VLAVVAAAWAARPRMRAIRRSFETSSSPGARFYDLAAGVFLGGYYHAIAAECATVLDGVTAPTVLEVGPGPGQLGTEILTAVPDLRWTGLDIDPAMLQAARSRLAKRGLADWTTLVEGDVAALPFEDATFDLVVSSLSAHHWPDAEAGFREIRRVLRRSGAALVYDVPAAWGRLETGSNGIDAAAAAFDEARVSRFRGIGPLTIVARVELRGAS
jgi:ubiquinone/menaquinone biosynthesis C-methylase UbiE